MIKINFIKILNLTKYPRVIKNFIVIFLDIVISFLSVWIAFYLRIGSIIPYNNSLFVASITSILILIPIFKISGLYKTIFRYFNLVSAKRIFNSSLIYGVIYSFLFTIIGFENIPRTIGLIQPILLFIFVYTSRLFISSFINFYIYNPIDIKIRTKALIYGAGKAGRDLLSALKESKQIRIEGFLDDDKSLQGGTINNLLIENPENLKNIINLKKISHIFLAIPSAKRARRKEIINKIKNYKLTIRTIPSFTDIASGKISVKELRDLEIDDLLEREIVEPNYFLLEKNIKNKIVLITGAGGSIGSELCRQIIQLKPKRILLVEMSEYALYILNNQLLSILNELNNNDQNLIIPLLASVQDKSRLNQIISTFKPNTIFHAAAYKHVPIVEQNIIEGIKNNIFGTLNAANSSIKNEIENFVLISTDKAVRPTNIMGASKRFAEICLQSLFNHHKQNSKTVFSIVRFGNVLDSSGSVIPKFREQIKNGGPITLTHSEVMRYFMTIPEAAQLVIQASAMANGGEVFVLDMGKPVKIETLAKRMIKLSGLTLKNEYNTHGDIEIKITGLRPGEKLYEELLIGDNPEQTDHIKIKKAKDPYINWNELVLIIKELENSIENNDFKKIIKILKESVIGFKPSKKMVDLTYLKRKTDN